MAKAKHTKKPTKNGWPNNYLSSININGNNIAEFDGGVENYNYYLDINTTDIELSVTTVSEKAKISGIGEYKITEDTTKEIVVTAENGDVKTYVINVTRKSDAPTTTIKELESVLEKTTAKEVIVEIKDDNTVLDSKTLTVIKNSKKQFVINHYVDNMIRYSWTINGNNIGDIKTIETYIKFTSNNKEAIDKLTGYSDSIYLNFGHEGKLPKGTKVKIYVGDKYQDETMVGIYHYNQDKNKIDTINKEIKVVNGYVEFDIEHCSEYIITRANINSQSFNWFILISIIEFVLFTGYIVCDKFILKRVKNKNK